MKAKKWFFCFLTIALSLLFLCVLLVVAIDPYFHFHRPLNGIGYRMGNQRYMNDGIARNFEYNAVITGTSMCENFSTSQFDTLFGVTSVKLPYAGAGNLEICESLERTLEYQKDVKLVLCPIDYASFFNAWNAEGYNETEYPSYLYDNSIWNDYRYIFNKETLLKGVLPSIFYTVKGEHGISMDDYSVVEGAVGPEVVLPSERPQKTSIQQEYTIDRESAVKENIEKNCLKIVKEHPDIQFLFFFPPYSIAEWEDYVARGTFEMTMKAQMTIAAELLQYSNVKLYGFLAEYEMITDLNNYLDAKHYTKDISSRLLDWIAEESHLLSLQNMIDYNEDLISFYTNYNYDSLYSN